jgi:hypothetical protein
LTWHKNLLPTLAWSVDGPRLRTVSIAPRHAGAAASA